MALTRAYFYSFALFSLCLCLDLAQAASGDFFTHPPPEDTTNSLSDNQVYKVGDLLQIEWETSMKDFALLLWQDGPSLDNNGGLFRNDTGFAAYNWSVALTVESVTFDTTETSDGYGPSFFLAMYNETGSSGGTSPVFRTHSFNITGSSSTTTTTSVTSSHTSASTATSSTSSTSSLKSAATTTSTPSPSPTPAPITNTSSGLTTGQQAGIGVGVGIAGLLAIVAIALLIRRRSGREAPIPTQPALGGPYHDPGPGSGLDGAGKTHHQQQPLMSELGGGVGKTHNQEQPLMSELGSDTQSRGPSELPAASSEYYQPSSAMSRSP